MLSILSSMRARVSYRQVEAQARSGVMCLWKRVPKTQDLACWQEWPCGTSALAACHSSAFFCVILRTECEVYS
jgi:hypothetical protein